LICVETGLPALGEPWDVLSIIVDLSRMMIRALCAIFSEVAEVGWLVVDQSHPATGRNGQHSFCFHPPVL
jgi:hypothetical protein